jgi:hypothetical protein
MDEVASQILSYRTLILMVANLIGTFFVRRIVETAFPKVKQAAPETKLAVSYTNAWSVWWNQVILYAIPVLIGIGLAVSVTDWMPAEEGMLPISKAGLVIYGGITGWFSGFGYKVVRKVLKQKTGIDLPSLSNPPPPGTDEVVVVAQDQSTVNVVVRKEVKDPSTLAETLPGEVQNGTAEDPKKEDKPS